MPAVLWCRRWAIAFVAVVGAGMLCRLVWLGDVEYKADETWLVAAVEAFWNAHVLRPVGIPSSAGLPHPGLSLWLFWGISAVLPSIGPLELTRAVQLGNVLAVALLAVFVRTSVERSEREAWLWSVALVAVNPLAVLYSRKLWAQDLLPLFSLAMLLGWWHRRRRWGAFLWGLVGALIGQVHLTGFIFAAAFLGWTFLFDRRSTGWPAWLGGSALGAIPLLPWLFLATQYSGDNQPLQFNNPAIPFGHWINFSLGIDLFKTLGGDFTRFLAFPAIDGRPTYLAAASIAAIVAIFVVLVARFLLRLRADNTSAATILFRNQSSTALAINASFFAYCFLLFLIPRPVYMHYMIIAFNLPALWLVWLARHGNRGGMWYPGTRRLLAGLVVAQLALSAMFLAFVHQQQVIDGDYGTAYGAQIHSR